MFTGNPGTFWLISLLWIFASSSPKAMLGDVFPLHPWIVEKLCTWIEQKKTPLLNCSHITYVCAVNWVGIAQQLWSSGAAVCSNIRYNRSYRDCTVAQSYTIAITITCWLHVCIGKAMPCINERGSIVIFNLPLLCPCPQIISASQKFL